MTKRLPLVLVAGFLGAGKTTFLRDILPLLESRGLVPSVIINDYANAKIDASSLAQEGREVLPITGSCICCDSIHELMEALLDILVSDHGVVLVEANGTSAPASLIEHLLVNPPLREKFDPMMQVTVIDLRRWQNRKGHNDLERLQVETASHLLFTREDSETKKRIKDVCADLRRINAKAIEIQSAAFADELVAIVRKTKHGSALQRSESAHHHHATDQHELAHAFVGLDIALPDPIDGEVLAEWLEGLGPDVLRAKGIVRLTEEPEAWFQFQMLPDFSRRIQIFELNAKPAVSPCAVLIGVGLDRTKIQSSLNRG